MFIYNLQQSNISNEAIFNLKFSDTTENNIYISDTLFNYLNKTKKKIDNFPISWSNIKKYTNEYEYVHTPLSINKQAISKIKPLSRAFFKLIEIYNYNNYKNDKNIKTFHLAEGPGGFIEATHFYRNNKNDIYYGMSLTDPFDPNVPGWNKAMLFLKTNINVKIINGKDKTGNLYSPCNFIYCVEKFKNSMEIITADGGFDFSIDFNKQELMASRLILTEVFYAIMMQKKNGIFILKVFDTFLKISVEILYILSCFYKDVKICKPNTSRMANSEKYIICSDFKLENSEKYFNIFKDILIELNLPINKDKYISSILNYEINYFFKNKIEESNAIFGNKQINNILTTIRFIENDEKKTQKLQAIKINNIKKCIDWCKANNIPYNNYNNISSNEQTNVFISKN